MTTYRAMICRTLGGRLEPAELPRPALKPGEIRIRIDAAGVNFPDVLMMRGLYQFKPPLPFVPGMECAGRVVDASPGSVLKPGDAVFAMTRTGAFAEEIVLRERDAMPLPAGFSMAEGATFAVAVITAWHGLATRGRLQAGQTVLVLGAAGGVGAASVQIAAALGATVIAAASSREKLDVAARLGAQHVINYRGAVLEDEVSRLTEGRGVDLILDPVGWDAVSATRCLAFGGAILIAGFAAGTIPSYPANRLLLKSASLVGVRAGEAGRNDPDMRQREWSDLLALAERSPLKPFVSERFELKDAQSALDMLAERRALGRIAILCA